jgi:excinuclease UvrABC nuclease subunit
MDVSKEGRNKMTRETLLDRKDSVINLVIEIMEIAIENDDFEMARKLKNYIKLLENYS